MNADFYLNLVFFLFFFKNQIIALDMRGNFYNNILVMYKGAWFKRYYKIDAFQSNHTSYYLT